MNNAAEVAVPFIDMAHRIVWASVATVGPGGVPRSRVLHPIWERGDTASGVVGWIATMQTPLKLAHIDNSPWVTVSYWSPDQDNATADCRATWHTDSATRHRVWDMFVNGPEPVGYDPSIIPGWDSPDSEAFCVLRLDPWRLRVFPGTLLLRGEGDLLSWRGELGQ